MRASPVDEGRERRVGGESGGVARGVLTSGFSIVYDWGGAGVVVLPGSKELAARVGWGRLLKTEWLDGWPFP